MTARPAALGFIFALVVVDVIAIGVVIPVLPRLVEMFKGGDTAYFETLKSIGAGASTKNIFPMEFTSLMTSFLKAKE